MTIESREYQIRGVEKLVEWGFTGDSSEVHTLVGVMSSGKTAMSCMAIDQFLNQGLRVWVISDRCELSDQWTKDFLKFNPHRFYRDIAYIADGRAIRYDKPFQIVQAQTLIYRLKKINDENQPDIVLVDEAHDVAMHRIVTKMKTRWPNIKQINLTATPVRHGNSKVQYCDLFPRKLWYQAATAQQMLAMGRWKKPNYFPASDTLAEKTAQRFSGMKITGEDYDDTAQSAVMIDLLPDQLREVLPNLEDRSTLWFVVDTRHGLAVYEALKESGRSVAFISGDEKITCCSLGSYSRKDLIQACRDGQIKHLVTINTLVKGSDIPILSNEVWLRRTMSVSVWCQGVGRCLRYYAGLPEGRIYDLAGNLALHPFPEEIDWWVYNPCKKLFRDPYMVICKNCNHRHDNIPTPIHPQDRRIPFSVGTMQFNDGLHLPLNHHLVCHECNAPIFVDLELLGAYALWLKSISSAVMAGSSPQKFEYHSAGISIGLQMEIDHPPLTIEIMYELGIWKFTGDRQAEVQNKDRSDEYRKFRAKLIENFSNRELREYRFSLLSPDLQDYLIKHPASEIEQIKNKHQQYRAAVIYSYAVLDKSPFWASKYWPDSTMPDKDQIANVLKTIVEHNPESWPLLRDWIVNKLEATDNHKQKGTCRKFLQVLSSIKNE